MRKAAICSVVAFVALATMTVLGGSASARETMVVAQDDEDAPRPTSHRHVAGERAYRAVPAPDDIFDFHAHGSEAWRSPFVIDDRDGPLAADLRRSEKQLHKFHEEQARTAKTTAVAARCKAKPARDCGSDRPASARPPVGRATGAE